jgi:hypothetical protein
MHPNLSYKKIRIAFITTVSIGIWALLIWQHFHGGVPSHSFMARKDMPSISNWWGGLLLPLLAYSSLFRLKKRLNLTTVNSIISVKQLQSVLLLFGAGLLYAGAMAYCFETDKGDINGILFQGLFVLALIFPLYRAEFFLGFVIGLTYTFGAILPTFIAVVFVSLSFIVHKYVYPFVLKIFIGNKAKN